MAKDEPMPIMGERVLLDGRRLRAAKMLPAVEQYDQTLSLVHRPGQTRSVEHIRLVVRNTVDSQIMRERAEVIGAILAEIKS